MKDIFEIEINNKNEIINKVCDLIRIPSISDEQKSKEKMPFGEECNNALEYILDLGKQLGFRTKNIDGYCGYIEFGDGDEILGIVSHIDVVPAEENDWKITKPFQPKIVENKIYGRGAIDDKGPTIAVLYAMKAVKDTVKTNKRIRLIIGLNEEKDWKCIEYYKTKEEIPSIGFSPDADFPCIYAEKGLLNVFIEGENSNNIRIEKIDCKNNAMNVVPKYVECIINYDTKLEDLENNIKNIIREKNYDITIEKISENHIKIISRGIASHAAHPDLGKNAITQMLLMLSKIYEKYNIQNNLVNFFKKYLKSDYNGNLLQINNEDESGNLTLNIARLELKKDKLAIGMNLRIPIDTNIEFVKNIFIAKCSEFKGLQVNFNGEKQPLFVHQDSKLITILTQIFNKHTQTNAKPITIGGATYARAFKNFASYGPNMPGEKDLCHQSDEYISIDNLIISAKIYANAIYELDKLNKKG